MTNASLNIRLDKETKDKANELFSNITLQAIEEGRRIANDGYDNIKELREALGV